MQVRGYASKAAHGRVHRSIHGCVWCMCARATRVCERGVGEGAGPPRPFHGASARVAAPPAEKTPPRAAKKTVSLKLATVPSEPSPRQRSEQPCARAVEVCARVACLSTRARLRLEPTLQLQEPVSGGLRIGIDGRCGAAEREEEAVVEEDRAELQLEALPQAVRLT